MVVALAEHQHHELALSGLGFILIFDHSSSIFSIVFFQLFLNYFSSRAIIVVAKCRWAINHGFAEFTTG